MCGIVGYIGNKQAQDVLLHGLGKLEYRGYDSAGIAIFENGAVTVKKSVGRLANLAELVDGTGRLSGNQGIGHTRWATHGRPSDNNAHPHQDDNGNFTIVHNGIIENYQSLREELTAMGHTFLSETDTEVVAHLLDDMWTGDLFDTVLAINKRIHGAFALGIMAKQEPGKLIAVRKQSPLVIGLGEGENFIASDIPAILEYTRNVYILDDGEIAVLTADAVKTFDLQGNPTEKEVYEVTWSASAAEKGGYDHFMLKEIHEQPKAISDTLTGRISEDGTKVVFDEVQWPAGFASEIDRIHILACGTSWHAGMVGKHAIEKLTRIPVDCEIASEYRYRDPIVSKNTLMVVITQSGETADTLAALRQAKEQGTRILAITNVVGSSAAREADDVIFTWAGPEISVASTKAYTTQLTALYLFAGWLAQERGSVGAAEVPALLTDLRDMPAKAETVLETSPAIETFAKQWSSREHAFFIGRGLDYAVSMEGSLKLKEISYMHAEAYAAGELKHGTLALIVEDIPVIALVTQDDLYEKTVSNIQEVKARDAFVLALAWSGDTEIGKTADQVIHIPRVNPFLAPIIAVIPLQLLAYYASVARGNDVDNPRNLAKSVTVE
ncbi:glutamine--fructose-6-phosphate transaminase (isomerizing) [Tumebacillus permanentifrigoris]|uniref:Glutamine--fructose-6-phosphate aminotransferase [isomerizing] n=1 Tax=Tumebacillus permanentifrigoris TaxID=378543 RepID=A0A316DF11_9BACL|nr:glutamine--fructose-6-phosphate transaminase (isomerizing) [Tumebacillus permanentifrigoris]PWK16152.1 glutamine--fructose-6-phosphate transaminase [Tumebacillus permanentifrigoris]